MKRSTLLASRLTTWQKNVQCYLKAETKSSNQECKINNGQNPIKDTKAVKNLKTAVMNMLKDIMETMTIMIQL